MTDWTKIVSGEALITEAKERATKVKKKSKVSPAEAALLKSEGWKIVKETKKGIATLEQPKRFCDIFENEVWSILYKMGFTHMNAGKDIKIDLNGNTKKIDVLAMDDETCLFVECKSSEILDKTSSFKKELESIHGYYGEVCQAITEQFGPRKFRLIFATKNYVISDDSADMQRINAFGFSYMDQDIIDYYDELTKHLGSAARYQLLGNLFKGETIAGLETRVPAICGSMGGHTYYSFLIDPQKLLKIAYILHRNRANHLLMPTYQRLIKKDRLKNIRDFVSQGGFFPGALVVSIDSKGAGVLFEDASQTDNASSKMGILSLPAKYRSVYVIDGQHRLYGYSDSSPIIDTVIPVVAFVDLDSKEQVKMFMDINENQKKVSKTLRNTLNIDLLWDSSDPKSRREALTLKIAEALGERHSSPLYGRILTGEDKENNLRCITTDYIKDALKNSSFLNEYNKSGVTKQGTFDKGSNDATFPMLLSFLEKCFALISEYCSEDWRLGRDGFLAINNSTYAIIKIIDDIVNIKTAATDFTIGDVEVIYAECEDMLYHLCDAIGSLAPDDKEKIKKAKGGGAKKEAWRVLQVALHAKCPEFTNQELITYIEDNCTDNNPESEQFIQDIENEIKARFRNVLEQDSEWKNTKLPESLAIDIASRMATENTKRSRNGGEQIDEWHIISFDEISTICRHSNNWSSFAKNLLLRPSSDNLTQANAITWLKELSTLKSKLKNNKPIIRSEFETLKKLHQDFCNVESIN